MRPRSRLLLPYQVRSRAPLALCEMETSAYTRNGRQNWFDSGCQAPPAAMASKLYELLAAHLASRGTKLRDSQIACDAAQHSSAEARRTFLRQDPPAAGVTLLKQTSLARLRGRILGYSREAHKYGRENPEGLQDAGPGRAISPYLPRQAPICQYGEISRRISSYVPRSWDLARYLQLSRRISRFWRISRDLRRIRSYPSR